ncbi:putative LuxR family two component transcriptional regulator [Candidatus Hydrogenisulfobacillus filiaventi]|uniref:Putative LuxR family two component transcriptional regulator n=1 Tax=Candidatus Hydrogenisulfobacillus filiaventi TaxID=2707344 RepID=A0A6F8ZCY4_9FIRM|nr:LuxR C-terminal-related transcriptional regulator [Bacillota bacterium]CAB1127791.1 putative LuxR family two component transcriptional regulator [Candidatus Hydrogenisulfobacillus filiaventi]
MPAPRPGRPGPVTVVLAEGEMSGRPPLPLAAWAAAGIRVTSTVHEARALVQAVADTRPDLVVVDCALPGAGPAEVVRAVAAAAPAARVVVAGNGRGMPCLKAALAAGARAWLRRESLTSLRAVWALQAVAHGHRVLDGQIPGLVNELLGPEGWFLARDRRLEGLLPREREVVRLIVMGHTVAEIAAEMGVSVKTVHTYRARAMHKLGVATRGELVRQVLGGGP